MKQETKYKAGILSMALLSMAPLGISPSIASIARSFPNASISEIQMIMAIPNLMALVAAVLVARIANILPRKAIAIAGPSCVLIGGLTPFFIGTNLPILYLCSGILGLGTGMISNITQVLTVDLIPTEDRQTVMAQNTMCVNMGGIFMTYVGGAAAVYGWHNNYLIYLIAAPIVIAVVALLPAIAAKAASNVSATHDYTTTEQKPSKKSALNPTVLVIAILGFAFMLLYNIFPNNISLLIEDGGLGDASTAGTANSICLIGGLISGLILGKIVPYFQKHAVAVAFGMFAVSLFVLGFPVHIAVVYVGSFFVGFAMTIYMAQCPFLLSLSTDSTTMPTAMAAFSIGSSLAGFVSPSIMNFISSSFLGGNVEGMFMVAGCLAMVVCVLVAITRFQAHVLASTEA